MVRSFLDRAKQKFEAITSIGDFEDAVRRELEELSKLTDDIALVVVGHLHIEKKIIDVLNSFFNYEFSRGQLENAQYSQLVTFLRLSNLCNENILMALQFLGKLRNRFAHDIVSLSLLDKTNPKKDNELMDSFHAVCQSNKISNTNPKQRYIDLLKRIYVELRKAELLAKEMNRYVSTPDFVDSLETIKV